MRICIINSSYEGVNSPFEKYDDLPDPGRYIPKTHHEFFTRWVTKANHKEEIDRYCAEGFDMYMNYMWGIETDNVAGVEETKYLESKGVVVLTNPAKFLAKNKVDLQEAATRIGNPRIPTNTPGKYPKIVKYADGYGSMHLDANSICHTPEAVEERVKFMASQSDIFGIAVQDYIVGTECSAIVIEMGREVVALTPLQYVFPKDTPDDLAFLDWYNKFEAVDKGVIKYAFVKEQPAMQRLQEAAVQAFKAIDVTNGGGWARVDMRLERETGDVYVLEVNCIPVVFYPHGNTLGDDLVVGEEFPGAQRSFFDVLAMTKQIQLGELSKASDHIGSIYDTFSTSYDNICYTSGLYQLQQDLVKKYDFSGSVLDVACGTGMFGKTLHDAGISATLTGIDLSEHMLENENVKRFYKDRKVGSMQELVMSATEHDHITCFGAIHFLNPVHFNAVLARMFMLARRSITFEIDDVDESYISDIARKHGDLCQVWNLVQTLEDFGTPKGWSKTLGEPHVLFKSPATGHDISGFAVRFQRD